MFCRWSRQMALVLCQLITQPPMESSTWLTVWCFRSPHRTSCPSSPPWESSSARSSLQSRTLDWSIHFRVNVQLCWLQIRHPISAEIRMWGTVTGCHAGCQEVDRLHQKWFSGNVLDVCLRKVRIRLPTLALKPRGNITKRSKQGYQWPHKWACVHQIWKIFFFF